MDLSWGVPRWNCSLQLVEAIPSWRVFVFGGTADVYGEVGQRRLGVAFGKKQRGVFKEGSLSLNGTQFGGEAKNTN